MGLFFDVSWVPDDGHARSLRIVIFITLSRITRY
jgi:hypothetical protein